MEYITDNTLFSAMYKSHEAANHFLIAVWVKNDHSRDWHYNYAIEQLTAAVDVLGYDMIKRQPAAPAEPVLSETDSAVRDLLRATADAGYMRAADYVALNEDPPAVTEQPGFDGRDITMRD